MNKLPPHDKITIKGEVDRHTYVARCRKFHDGKYDIDEIDIKADGLAITRKPRRGSYETESELKQGVHAIVVDLASQRNK